MADPYVGEIRAVAFNFAPVGWALCAGQLISISQYQALFALLGTYYGGNGTQTFGLPDLRGRTAIGVGQGLGLPNYILGESSGNYQFTLTNAQLPTHTHTATFVPSGGGGTPTVSVTVQGSASAGTTSTPTGNYIAGVNSPIGTQNPKTSGLYVTGSPTDLGNIAGVSATISGVAGGGGTVTNALTGQGLPFPTQPPYLTITYIIALQGIYPTRS